MFHNILSENRAVYEIMWDNNVQLGQSTDGNVAHALCVLDKLWLQTHNLSFQLATMFARTRLGVMLHVHYLPFFFVVLLTSL